MASDAATPRETGKILKFLASGLPAFALAVPLNWLLVAHVGLNKALAYALVLLFQITANFVMCRFFVFRSRGTRHWLVQFWQLGAGSAGFRCLEWCVYNLMVSVLGVPYILAQLLNVFIFVLFKFKYAKTVMER